MSAETQKPWEMNQKEYEQWYQDNMGEKDNIPYSERVSQWKKQGKLTLILSKPTTLDKSGNSSIMTSNKGEKDDNNRRTVPTELELRTTARIFESQNRSATWKKMSRKEQDNLVKAKAASARRIAENYITTGMASCVAWPRAIREEILERDSD